MFISTCLAICLWDGVGHAITKMIHHPDLKIMLNSPFDSYDPLL